jgi:anaerobic dimethyl sulfoxide reductase subunit B (iron-sulfur subunit)
VTTHERGTFPDLSVSFLIHCCYHCSEPACAEVCPTQSIIKREEDGIVVVNSESCLGKEICCLCAEACPYKAPQFRQEHGSAMEKCDLCVERWGQGRMPICVDSCPTRALDAGPMEELRAKYGNMREAEGFWCSIKTGPSIIFKPKRR